MGCTLFCHAYSCGNFPFYIVGLSKQLTSARRSCLLKFLFCHFIVSGTWRRPIASLMSFDARRAADMSFPKVHVVHTSREPTKLHNSKGGYIWQLGPNVFFSYIETLKIPQEQWIHHVGSHHHCSSNGRTVDRYQIYPVVNTRHTLLKDYIIPFRCICFILRFTWTFKRFGHPNSFDLDLVRCWGVPGTARYMTPTSYLELIKLFTDLLGTQLVPSWVRFATVFEWNFGNGGQWGWWWSVLHIFLKLGMLNADGIDREAFHGPYGF